MTRLIVLIISVSCFALFSYGLVLTLVVSEPKPDSSSIEIDQAFQIASEYIESLGVLPDRPEMQKWFDGYVGSNRLVKHLSYERHGEKTGLPYRLGEIPSDSYMLAYWRSEWMEVYAPWSGKTTMCDIEQSCHSIKKNLVPLIVYFLLGAYFLWGYNRLRVEEKSA